MRENIWKKLFNKNDIIGLTISSLKNGASVDCITELQKLNTLYSINQHIIDARSLYFEPNTENFKVTNFTSQEQEHYTTNIMNDFLRIKERLENLEISAEQFPSRPKRSVCHKRAIWRFGSNISKWFYGTPNADDVDFCNAKFKESESNENMQEALNKNNIKIVTNLLQISEKLKIR